MLSISSAAAWAQGGKPGLKQAAPAVAAPAPAVARCPADMVPVRGFCIDRYEMTTVDRTTGEPLSPYYPPNPKLLYSVYQAYQLERWLAPEPSARAMPLPELTEWQRTHKFEPRAESRRGLVPQGYLSYHVARRACVNAGKRLCTEQEWITACKGERATRFPYGDQFVRGKCNVFRPVHPAYVLHGDSSIGHRDPRLHLIMEAGREPLLWLTGTHDDCASRWGSDRVHDMVGNIDEWVEDERGLFLGGFYARSTTKGCEARVSNHAQAYYDYSTGGRCCLSLPP